MDKLTNPIEKAAMGDRFSTDISILAPSDLKPVAKKNKSVFDRKSEFKQPDGTFIN